MKKRPTREVKIGLPFDTGAAFGDATLAIRAGMARTQENEHSEAIFPTSSFVFNSAEEAAARFAGEEKGNIYSRFTNPTVRAFEERLAAMEGGERAVATSSGMAAIMAFCLAFLKQGDHVVCSRNVFGTTHVVFEKYLQKFGVTTSFVDLADTEAWRQAMQPGTRFLFLETPSNPLNEVADIRELADLAHASGALLVVDNCFCTPVLQKPLQMGADVVIHSATKFLDGQGRCVGGAVVGSNALMEEVFAFMRSGGFSMSPFNAWVFLKGLETLKIRMQAHCEQSLALAQWLKEQAWVESVYYCGLPDHPQHALAKQQQSGYGGVVSFVLSGGRQSAWSFINHTQWLSITANLGDVKTTITHPASTTHGRLSDAEKQKANIQEGLIRLCVGLEDIDDIKHDLVAGSQGLSTI